MKKQEHELNWLGIDLDKTIAHNSPHPDYALLEPIDGAREALQSLSKGGWRITIYTARHWQDYDIICEWLNKYKIPYDQVVCGKLFCRWMIDDKAIHFDSWDNVLKQIK